MTWDSENLGAPHTQREMGQSDLEKIHAMDNANWTPAASYWKGKADDAKSCIYRLERELEALKMAAASDRDDILKLQNERKTLRDQLTAEQGRADTLPELTLSVVAYELSCAGYDDAYSYVAGGYIKRMVEQQCRRADTRPKKA